MKIRTALRLGSMYLVLAAAPAGSISHSFAEEADPFAPEIAGQLNATQQDGAQTSYALPAFQPGADAGGAGRGEDPPPSIGDVVCGAVCSTPAGVCACVKNSGTCCNLQTCRTLCV